MIDIIIVGVPNVGKSTLFNKLLNINKSITYNQPGITRDVVSMVSQIEGIECTLYDTEGFLGQMHSYHKAVLQKAHIIFFVVDIHSVEASRLLLKQVHQNRRVDSKLVLLCNKCDIKEVNDNYECFTLGVKDVIFVSSEHKIGFTEVYDVITSYTQFHNKSLESVIQQDRIRLTVLGKPNVGKSTIVNKILQYDRQVVDNKPGTTVDTVNTDFEYRDHSFTIIDTAGIRRKNKVITYVEQRMTSNSLSGMASSDIVLFVVDITTVLERQDLRLIDKALSKNKVVIILLNKKDVVQDVRRYVDYVKYQCQKSISLVPIILPISALNLRSTNVILDKVIEIFNTANIWISTSKLNSWLQHVIKRHMHPVLIHARKKEMRFKYVVQTSKFPIILTIYTNDLTVQESYTKYLKNDFRKYFDMPNLPVQIKYKVSNNPYVS
ncbi:MAG: small GTP-binding domain protein [Candidatus Xenolissoclinum pacificiensis L6]|uniref:GTPase Der n=1 Tax=Candidatus Xenolissoclinum pacificiensis L6 TaxID=1401685 RepID=W2V2C7_9RICK|nr:MAG: small GTP-binding domain protein [Candidatus Xenolissoclinum pacificiensis L6]